MVIPNLGTEIRPDPEERLQEVKKLARRVICGSLLPMGEDDLLPIAVLITEEDSIGGGDAKRQLLKIKFR